MVKIDLIFSPDSSEDVAVKNLLRDLKLEHPAIIINELASDSQAGSKIVDDFGILTTPAIVINGELFSTGMISKEEVQEKIKSLQE